MGGASSNSTLLQPRRLFSEGSVVEVWSDEEDFKGVYFLATILAVSPFPQNKSMKRSHRKLHIEYHTLLVREDSPERLREYVDASFVRPAPPPLEDVKAFDINDSVDAFHKDGWWTGVVSRVLEGGRFIVTFQYPPDELEFGLAELRVHWDWCNGSWVRPEKQAIAASMFDTGKRVEVSFDDVDSKGAWFPATILKVLRKGAYIVEYHSSKTGLETELHKVTVDSSHVRPCFPSLKEKNYVLLEKVDSFFGFGWWSGVITKVLKDCRYVVFFKETKKEKEFRQSELRPRMEWKDGKWSTTSSFQLSPDVSIRSLRNEELSYPECENARGKTVKMAPAFNSGDNNDSLQSIPCLLNLDENQTESLISSNQKSSHDSRTLNKRCRSYDDSMVLSQAVNKLLKEGLSGACQRDTTDKSSQEFFHGSPANDLPKFASPPATDKQSLDNRSSRMTIRKNLRNIRERYQAQILEKKKAATAELERAEPGDREKKRAATAQLERAEPGDREKKRAATAQLERAEPGDREKEQGDMGNAAPDQQNDRSGNEVKNSLILGLPCVELGSKYAISRDNNGSRLSECDEITKSASGKKGRSGGSDTENMERIKQSETRKGSQKRKRGRPPKDAWITGNTDQDVEFGGKDSNSHITVEVVMTNMELTSDKNMDKTIDVSDCRNGNKSNAKETSHRILNENESICLRKDFPSKGRALEVEVEEVNAEEVDGEFEDRPLLKGMEGMQSPSIMTDSEVLSVDPEEQYVRKSCNVSEKQKQTDVYPSMCDGSDVIAPNQQQGLTLPRNNELWKMIDTMEVFKRMPQNPHFQPLMHLKDSPREGLAVGYMVTFSIVVEKAFKLQINDPETVMKDILETLEDLEKYGFDVKIVKDGVVAMLAIKRKQEILTEDMNEINRQVINHNTEKGKIDEEIREMKRQMLELEEKVSVTATVREEKEREIADLQSKLPKVEESMKSLGREFANLSASLSSSQFMN